MARTSKEGRGVSPSKLSGRSRRRPPQLTVFVGAGGVGKTTLSAAWALARARSGTKVGLLGIDPAQRLLTALGLSQVSDEGEKLNLPFACVGELRVAVLNVRSTLERWVREQGLAREQEALNLPFVRALSERFAAATDMLAAARIGEWLERFPETEELVLDTAPGRHAIDFLMRPDRLSEFLEGRVVEWLRWMLGHSRGLPLLSPLRSGARRLLDGLAVIGGENLLLSFAEAIVLLEEVLEKLVDRLRRARSLLLSRDTRFLVVAAVRHDSALVATDLCCALGDLRLEVDTLVVNRCVSESLQGDSGFREFLMYSEALQGSAAGFSRYAQEYLRAQQEVVRILSRQRCRVIQVGFAQGLDSRGPVRLQDLADLGQRLVDAREGQAKV